MSDDPSNSVKLSASKVGDNTEPILLFIERCNDYPKEEYTQVSGKGGNPILYRIKI